MRIQRQQLFFKTVPQNNGQKPQRIQNDAIGGVTDQKDTMSDEKNIATIENIRRRAKAGDPNARYELGCIYYVGRGIDRDYAEAFRWYMKAAEQGHNSGLCDVGYCYRNGHGVPQDFAIAFRYYMKVAQQGCPTGAFWVAHAYEHGEGVPRDIHQAVRWYEISGNRGDRDAADALKRLRKQRAEGGELSGTEGW